MTAPAIAMVPWRRLALWPDNPRRRIDEGALRELADSIAEKGVRQNLLARPIEDLRAIDNGKTLEVIVGQRRWRAVERLVRAGRVAEDFPVPVLVAAVDDHEALLLATVENVQRADMTPGEEADAFARLAAAGDSAETIAERTGLSLATVRKRLALAWRLAPEVRQALDDGRINLGLAAAFTVGEQARQRELLRGLLRRVGGGSPEGTAAYIRAQLLGGAVPMEWARFDPARYDGPLVRDLFIDKSYAEDRGRFLALQREAAEAEIERLSRIWSWAELKIGGSYVPVYDFDRDGAPAVAGAIVHLRDDLKIDIHTGLVRRPKVPRQAAAPSGPGAGAGGEKRIFGPPPWLRRSPHEWAERAKRRKLRAALADHPVAGLVLAILAHLPISWRNAPDPDLDEWLRGELGGLGIVAADGAAFEQLAAFTIPHLHDLLAALEARVFALGDDAEIAAAAARWLGLGPVPVTAEYLEQLDRAALDALARRWGVGAEIIAAGGGELIDAILLRAPPAAAAPWYPPELCFLEPREEEAAT